MKVNDKEIILKKGLWSGHAAASAEGLLAMYEVFKESGRIDAMNCNGYTGKTHPHWDSDVAKWIEAVAFYLIHDKNDDLYSKARQIIDVMERNQLEDGYYNSFYQTHDLSKRFTDRTAHELYCLGHHIEAAIAWHRATGENNFLAFCDRYIDLVYNVFYASERNGLFKTPGHEEIELALIKLYRYTGIEKYLTLAEYFILTRGRVQENGASHMYDEQYNQSHAPLEEQRTAEGHAVRANYIYTAMADYALIKGHEGIKKACKAIFEDTVYKKMHVHGGVGTSSFGECYTVAYDLPPTTAYAETCASIGLMRFCKSYFALTGDFRAFDVIERIANNILLASVSKDGKKYFYCNPLAVNKDISEYYSKIAWYYTSSKQGPTFPDSERKALQSCSCCPPNVARTLGSFEEFVYCDYDKKTMIALLTPSVCKYAGGEVEVSGERDKFFIKVTGSPVYMRVPSWSKTTLVDGKKVESSVVLLQNGEHDVALDLRVSSCYTGGKVAVLSGKVAFFYGPTLLCAEGVDNDGKPFNLIPSDNLVRIEKTELGESYVVKGLRREPQLELYSDKKPNFVECEIKLIPYRDWANRGKDDMTVWFDDAQ